MHTSEFDAPEGFVGGQQFRQVIHLTDGTFGLWNCAFVIQVAPVDDAGFASGEVLIVHVSKILHDEYLVA